ncbi:MAG: DUF362 domain-containing protein [Promethearchaeota archaeon]
MKNKVVVINQSDYDYTKIKEKLQEIIKIIVSEKKINNKTILIKPNCGPIAKPEEGLTVHPVVLKALIQIIKNYYPREIIIAESSYVENNTMTAIKTSGLMEIIEEEGLQFVDIKKEQHEQIKISGLSLKKIKLPKLLKQVDLILSLAKLKTNVAATVTLSIKNLKGLIPDSYKKKFHLLNLANSIYDLYSNINIEKIGIIDGILGSELYNPKKGDILAGSNDLISLDVHCAELMGFRIEDVKHLNLFQKPQYQLISDIRSMPNFNKPLSSLEDIEKEYNVKILGTSACSNCIGALIRGLQKAKKRKILRKKITFVIGPLTKLGLIKDNNIISIGNCSANDGFKSIHVAGCPPISNQVVEAISQYHNF